MRRQCANCNRQVNDDVEMTWRDEVSGEVCPGCNDEYESEEFNQEKENAMTPTGIKVTEEERQVVEIAQKTSGMFLSGGMPMGDPGYEVKLLCDKYHPPESSGFNLKTGEFMLPD